jgi:single-strand DNA-binding protein
MFEITGTIKRLFPEQTFGSGFTKREFVLTTAADRYPQDLKFECVKEKIALLADRREGDKVKVSFDLRGREWKDNYYVNLAAWKIELVGEGAAATDTGDEPLPEEPGATVDPADDDIPF